MRILFLTAILTAAVTLYGQPTLLHTWNNSVSSLCTSSGLKYIVGNYTSSNNISLYNDDYSLFKTINITWPLNVVPIYGYVISAGVVTSDGKYAYILIWDDTSNGYTTEAAGLYEEDGTSLLTVDSGSISVYSSLTGGNSAELIASNYITGVTELYSLPGCLPQCTGGCSMSGIIGTGQNPGELDIHPIPSSGKVNLRYQLPDGAENGDIVLFSVNGQEIKSIHITDRTGSLTDEQQVPSGSYFYQLRTNQGNTTRKIIFIP